MESRKERYVVSFSGGKDSTAMLFMLLENDMPVDEVVWVDTGAEYPELYRHVEKVKSCLPKEVEFTVLKPKHDFFSYALLPLRKRGRYKDQGFPYGFPSVRRRWCTGFLKLTPLRRYRRLLASKGKVAIMYVGLSFDEERRFSQCCPNTLYPLVETFKTTSKENLRYCYRLGFDWDGAYQYVTRLSCYPCPFTSIQNLRYLYHRHPNLWKKILRAERYLKSTGCPFWKFKPGISAEELNKRFGSQLWLFRDIYVRRGSM